ncbi:MAG: phosphoribosyl transferase [Pseudonocardiales bacterium]|nr:MAG: phosphoribosyl transferase [Pseudonocardiales bacterium]
MKTRFATRAEAGHQLGARVAEVYAGADPVVLGLPRGGVPVAAAVAAALDAPMDVFVVCKLGVPWQPELAFGAVASGGVRVLNEEVVAAARLDEATINRETEAATAEVERRELAYRGAREPLVLHPRTVILVDDGIATGATVRAALAAVRAHGAAAVVVAAPVAPVQVVTQLSEVADRVIVLVSATRFGSVGSFYVDFDQLSDFDVQAIVREQT